MTSLTINGQAREISAPDDMPLLWAIRDIAKLTGTKYGCGIAQCGACTVHIDGSPAYACSTPASGLEGRDIKTIEGLAEPDGTLHPLQQAWIDHDVPQCGYCQSGQIMQAANLIEDNAAPTDEEISSAMNGNLCRCMAYSRIRKAIKVAASGQEA